MSSNNVGHVVGTLLCLWMLARYGRQKWMAASASQVTPYPVTVRSRVVLGVAVLAGTTVALALVLRGRAGSATDVLRVAAGCFASLVAACAYLEPAWAERSATTRLASSE